MKTQFFTSGMAAEIMNRYLGLKCVWEKFSRRPLQQFPVPTDSFQMSADQYSMGSPACLSAPPEGIAATCQQASARMVLCGRGIQSIVSTMPEGVHVTCVENVHQAAALIAADCYDAFLFIARDEETFLAAREVAGHTPLVAVVPTEDEQWEARLIDLGAAEVHGLKELRRSVLRRMLLRLKRGSGRIAVHLDSAPLQQILQLLLLGGHGALIFSTPNGRIVEARLSASLAREFFPQGVLGRFRQDLIHPEDAAAVEHRLLELARTPGDAVELSFRAMAGGARSWQCRGVFANQLHDPSIGAIVGYLREVTD